MSQDHERHGGDRIQRRVFIHNSVAATIAGSVVASAGAAVQVRVGDQPIATEAGRNDTKTGGRLRHSVCRWAFGGLSLETLCKACGDLGIESIELLGPEEWPIVRQHGLTCAVANGPTQIGRGLNRTEDHDRFVRASDEMLPRVAEAGIPNMIVFSGNRAGLDDAEGLRNCATALRRMVPAAEALGVTLVMELLNSRVDHHDYQCDRTAWGVALVEAVGSPRFRLLYDVYHMQIMEGDIIRTMTRHVDAIGHVHTGGNPGRREIDGTQELNYRAICTALADAGYRGFVGQEFIPSRDPIQSLREAVAICTV